MLLDLRSFLIGFTMACALAVAWTFGEQKAIRLARRVARHGKDLDRVFFEDAERDGTIEKPKPVTHRAELHAIEERQSGR